jgi:NOL1/NOP2/fmu family ribosome biogenesis protein
MGDYDILENRLKLLSPGIKICAVKKNGYVPAHELSLSQGIRKDAFNRCDIDYSQAVSYLRRDNFRLPDISKGWLIATYKDVSLGLCNNIGSRINNYYPVEWRIRMSIPEASIKNIIFWDS